MDDLRVHSLSLRSMAFAWVSSSLPPRDRLVRTQAPSNINHSKRHLELEAMSATARVKPEYGTLELWITADPDNSSSGVPPFGEPIKDSAGPRENALSNSDDEDDSPAIKLASIASLVHRF
jgi:hypothetical protein